MVNHITNNFNSCSQHVCKRALENDRDQELEKVQIPLFGLGEGNDPVTVGGKEASRCNLPVDSGHMPARPGNTDGTTPGQIQASNSEQEGVTSRGPVWKWKQGPGDPYSVDKYSNKATTLLRIFDGQKEIPAISVSRTLAARIEEAIDTGRDFKDIVADLSKVSEEIETRASHQHEVRPKTMATGDKIDGRSLRHRKLDDLIEQKSQLQREAKQAEENWKNFCSKALLVLDDVWVKAGIAKPRSTDEPNKVAQTNRIPEKSMEGMLSSSKAKDPSASTEPRPLLRQQYENSTRAAPSMSTTPTVMRAEIQPELLRKSSELSVSSPVTNSNSG